MGMQKDPLFKEGQKVVSFRGEKATVRKVHRVDDPSKSHRVEVDWRGSKKGSDQTAYYESVFEPDGTGGMLHADQFKGVK